MLVDDVNPDSDSIRDALDHAWRDHHHIRNQTWKALQLEAAAAAGIIALDVNSSNFIFSFFGGIFIFFISLFCSKLIIHHRKAEILKFKHIINFQRALGLQKPNLICEVKAPQEGLFNFRVNTSQYLMVVNLLIAILTMVFLYLNFPTNFKTN